MADTTTTTTTRTTTRTTTVTVNVGYLIPHGLLKILEILLCLIILSLIASVVGTRHDALNFPLVISIIFFISTIVLLVFFMCGLIKMCCGEQPCYIIDTVHNALAVILFFIGFIILCIYCRFRYGNYTYLITELLVAAILALINMILYILSLVFARRAGMTPTITVRSSA